jgi:hypothetical protein
MAAAVGVAAADFVAVLEVAEGDGPAFFEVRMAFQGSGIDVGTAHG